MPKIPDHNRIIGEAAKASLAPIGCKQKGRSRTWIDDHLWWIIVVEFQPSAWGKGSYLNVGAMWLWNAKGYYSFDDGGRIEPFQQFAEEIQFSEAATKLGESAAAAVLALREKFRSVDEVAKQLAEKQKKSIWDHFHSAMAALVTGNTLYAQSEFEAVAMAPVDAPWVLDLQSKAKSFSNIAGSIGFAREAVCDELSRARKLLKLPPLAVSTEIWNVSNSVTL